MELLNWFKLDVLLALAGMVGLITQVIKAIPVKWTSDYPKMIAWVVAAFVVGGIGYYEGAGIEVIIPVVGTVALVAHGLYDVISGLIAKIKK